MRVFINQFVYEINEDVIETQYPEFYEIIKRQNYLLYSDPGVFSIIVEWINYGFITKPVTDPRLHYDAVRYKILDLQEYIESELDYFKMVDEAKRIVNENPGYNSQKEKIETLFYVEKIIDENNKRRTKDILMEVILTITQFVYGWLGVKFDKTVLHGKICKIVDELSEYTQVLPFLEYIVTICIDFKTKRGYTSKSDAGEPDKEDWFGDD